MLTIVVLAIYTAFIPESARWLLQRGKFEEVSKILKKVAQENGVTLSDKIKRLQDVDIEKGGQSFWYSFRWTTLLIRSLIIFLNWMVASMVYYGLSLNAGDLSGNIYVNFVLLATAELASFLFSLFIMDITGRKKLQFSSMIHVMYGGKDLGGGTVGFAVIYVYTAELFSTVVRNSVIGVCSVCARMGGTLAPFIGDKSRIVGGKLEIALPLVIFGGLSVLAGGLVLFLPETSQRTLPETMEDAKRFGRSPILKKQNHIPNSDRGDIGLDFEKDNIEALLERTV
ncbi:hypothetical protein RRG08_013029 [Elysia crispata]|uniref:Uncharacterized protein n=1 Tax=Elysia crispata TaxID=231223 RepID=A0AAE1A0M0_9GAST|nr:hypothetical protein RRG08_013029 [Elysia crispata]